MNSHPVIDVFCGVGGLTLGAARAGFDIALCVDNDRKIIAAHQSNFPNVEHSCADLVSLTGNQLLELAQLRPGELIGLIGGPPCQGFSTIGRRDAGDPRNSLYCRFFDLVRQTAPCFYLVENVPGIMDDVHSRLRAQALCGLDDYTHIPAFKVCAADFGAPTSRTRVLFIGYRRASFDRELTASDFLRSKTTEVVTVGVALRGLPTKIKDAWVTDEMGWRRVRRQGEGEFWERVFGRIPDGVGDTQSLQRLTLENRVSGCIATNHTSETRKRFARLGLGELDPVSRARRLDPTSTCPTLRAGTARDRGSYQAVRPIHPAEHRVVTPREAARLQGFPDWFRFAPTKWHSFRQIGNSVSPIVAEAALRVIREHLVFESLKVERQAA